MPVSDSTYNEKALLSAVAEGKEQAFKELVLIYADQLHGYLFSHLRSSEMTEEIVQDIFLKVWQTRESLREIHRFRSYLFVIARNHALNELKKWMRKQKRYRDWLQQPVAIADEADDQLWKVRMNVFDEAVNQLPPQQQKAWIMSRQEGLKQAEIAQRMCISKDSVKKYIQFATESIIKYASKRADALLLLWLFLYNHK